MTFEIVFTDPAVQAAVISAIGGIIAALIAAIAAALIGKQIAGRKKLQSALQDAVADIEFLLGVENEHCNLHKEMSDVSYKQRVRQSVRDQGLEWTGRFTPGRVRSMSILRGE